MRGPGRYPEKPDPRRCTAIRYLILSILGLAGEEQDTSPAAEGGRKPYETPRTSEGWHMKMYIQSYKHSLNTVNTDFTVHFEPAKEQDRSFFQVSMYREVRFCDFLVPRFLHFCQAGGGSFVFYTSKRYIFSKNLNGKRTVIYENTIVYTHGCTHYTVSRTDDRVVSPDLLRTQGEIRRRTEIADPAGRYMCGLLRSDRHGTQHIDHRHAAHLSGGVHHASYDSQSGMG